MNRAALSFGVALLSLETSSGLATSAAPYSLGRLQYREIGPAIAGGRTTAVAGSNSDPHVYYAGGADGGVFKSIDGGATWRPVFDREDVAPIGAIAVAARDSADVWVGTGEANPRNDMERGDGIWHSSDGGNTWKHLGLNDAGSISAISIDPREPRRIVVAVLGQTFRDNTTRGIYTTRDGGSHWTHGLYVGASVGASDVVRVPDRPDTLFAGMYPFRRKPWTMISGGEEGGIYRSDDDGASWHRLIGRGLPTEATGRIGLAAGKHGRVFAIIQAREGDVWRSDNLGASWQLMPHSWHVGARPFYFSRVFVDPVDNDRLINVSLNLSMTKDGGRTFERIASNAGWDYHDVWWSSDGERIAVGSDEGLVMSFDGGGEWRQPYDLPFAQPYHVGYDDALPNYHVCIGLQDNNSWCGPANSDTGLGVLNREWHQVGPGDGMWAVYDPLDSNLVWSTSVNSGNGQVYLWDARTQQASEVSPDVELNGDLPAKDLRYRFNWETPIAFTLDGRALVGGNVVFESADHGKHWTIISPDLTRNDRAHQGVPGGPISPDMSGAEISDTILDVAPSPLDKNVMWVGTDDGVVQVTRDGGAQWHDVTPPQMPAWGRVATVEPGRFDAATAYAAVDHHMSGDDSPHLLETADYGATWTSISGNLPADLYVRSIRQDPKNPELLFTGTQRGVWASWDAGRHWQSLRLNMPASAIYDIHVHPRTNDLLVAAHGRGVWILDDLRAVQEISTISGAAVRLFALRDTYLWWQWAPINSFLHGSLPSDTFAGTNVDYGALITYWLPSKLRTPPTIDVLDAAGHIVRHLKGEAVPNKVGLNRTSWNLQEEPPTKWFGTFKDNQGPDDGAEVIPGVYAIRLRANGSVTDQPVVVRADPRAPADEQRSRQRHDFLAQLYGELDDLDKTLNAIDGRLRHASVSQTKALLALRARLTYNPRNEEDLNGPAQLRERLLDLSSRVSSTSYQDPTQADLDEAKSLQQECAAVLASSKAVFI